MKKMLLTLATTAALIVGGLIVPDQADAQRWRRGGWYGYRPYAYRYYRPYYYAYPRYYYYGYPRYYYGYPYYYYRRGYPGYYWGYPYGYYGGSGLYFGGRNAGFFFRF